MAVPTGLYFPLYFSCCSSPKVCSLRDTTYSRLERSQMRDWEITHYMSRSRETSAPLRIPFHRVTPDWMIPEESMKPQSLENIHPEGVKEKELHWASHFTLPKCGATSAQLIDRSPEAREAQWSWDRDTLANALRILNKFTCRFAPNWFLQGVRLYILFADVTRLHILILRCKHFPTKLTFHDLEDLEITLAYCLSPVPAAPSLSHIWPRRN